MKTILFLCGGRSEEHEISLISAKGILDALDRKQYQPLIVGISKKGVWHLEEEKTFYTGEFRADKIRLNEEAPAVAVLPCLNKKGRGELWTSKAHIEFDCVFPILHGQYGEDGTLQGMLDIMHIPYVGSTCGSSYICMDKVLAKILCSQEGIPVADFCWIDAPDQLDSKRSEIEKLGFPVFVKPSRQGSSVGVVKVATMANLPAAVREAFKFDSKVLIEKGIKGREIEISVLGNFKNPRVSLPGEIHLTGKAEFYSYDAKYISPDAAKTEATAKLSKESVNEIQKIAKKTYTLLECSGLARIDMFLEEKTNRIYLNEVNTLPGFTPISMYPKMWEASGIGYSELISELIELAFARGSKR